MSEIENEPQEIKQPDESLELKKQIEQQTQLIQKQSQQINFMLAKFNEMSVFCNSQQKVFNELATVFPDKVIK